MYIFIIFKADAALFAILVMWFQRPANLNMPLFKEFFSPKKGFENKKAKKYANKDAKILYNYMQRVKKTLGFDETKWTTLVQRPFPLNYEEENYGEKYDGLFFF